MENKKFCEFKIIDLQAADAPQVVAFADQYIGKGYYTLGEAQRIIQCSWQNGATCSIAAAHQSSPNQLAAIRLCLPPQTWLGEFDYGYHYPERWGIEANVVAYFKSLFVDEKYRGQKLGPYLSSLAIDRLKTMGARALVTHAWQESPNNSSLRYLHNIGFKEIGLHKGFWSGVDYLCTGCWVKPCTCTAVEMLLNL